MFCRILSNFFLIIGLLLLIVGVIKTITEKKKNKIRIHFKIITLSIIFINISYIMYSILMKNNLFVCGVTVLILVIISNYYFSKNLIKIYKSK